MENFGILLITYPFLCRCCCYCCCCCCCCCLFLISYSLIANLSNVLFMPCIEIDETTLEAQTADTIHTHSNLIYYLTLARVTTILALDFSLSNISFQYQTYRSRCFDTKSSALVSSTQTNPSNTSLNVTANCKYESKTASDGVK